MDLLMGLIPDPSSFSSTLKSAAGATDVNDQLDNFRDVLESKVNASLKARGISKKQQDGQVSVPEADLQQQAIEELKRRGVK